MSWDVMCLFKIAHHDINVKYGKITENFSPCGEHRRWVNRLFATGSVYTRIDRISDK